MKAIDQFKSGWKIYEMSFLFRSNLKKYIYITLAKTFLETYMYVLKAKTSKIVTLQKVLSCSKHSKIQHYNYLYKYKLTNCAYLFNMLLDSQIKKTKLSLTVST